MLRRLPLTIFLCDLGFTSFNSFRNLNSFQGLFGDTRLGCTTFALLLWSIAEDIVFGIRFDVFRWGIDSLFELILLFLRSSSSFALSKTETTSPWISVSLSRFEPAYVAYRLTFPRINSQFELRYDSGSLLFAHWTFSQGTCSRGWPLFWLSDALFARRIHSHRIFAETLTHKLASPLAIFVSLGSLFARQLLCKSISFSLLS